MTVEELISNYKSTKNLGEVCITRNPYTVVYVGDEIDCIDEGTLDSEAQSYSSGYFTRNNRIEWVLNIEC